MLMPNFPTFMNILRKFFWFAMDHHRYRSSTLRKPFHHERPNATADKMLV
jgi:hypothetical protein